MGETPKYSLLEAKQKIEAWCAYQERCDFEVRNKLHSWHLHHEDVDVLISDLITHNFLNEERFAEAYVSGKFRIKKWGRDKIKQHLKQKRISDYSIKKGIAVIDPDEYYQTLNDLAARKWNSSKGSNKWDKAAKVKRYLHSKGYEANLIHDAVSKVAGI